MPRFARRRAFTLIELLVVIAIIAILAAILFPVFAQAKDAAKKTSVVSAQKQIATGFALYQGDHDDTNPPVWNFFQAASGWDAMVSPYIKVGPMEWGTGGKSALFLDPKDTIPVRRDWAAGGMLAAQRRTYSMPIAPWDPGMGWVAGQYARLGGAIAGPLVQAGPNSWDLLSRPRTTSELEDPSGTLSLVENPGPDNIFGNNNGAECPSPDEQLPYTEGGPKQPAFWQDGWIYTFADTHVKHVKWARTIDGNSNDDIVGTAVAPAGMWSVRAND